MTGRTISTVVTGAAAPLSVLPGVTAVEQKGPRWLLHCNDSDAALRALLHEFPDSRDIEIAAGNLEDAFLELTGGTNSPDLENAENTR